MLLPKAADPLVSAESIAAVFRFDALIGHLPYGLGTSGQKGLLEMPFFDCRPFRTHSWR